MAYPTIPSTDYDPDSPITTTLFSNIIERFAGLAANDSGAPSIVNAALQSHPWGQSDLDTSLGSVSRSGGASSGHSTLPGGQYGSYPQTQKTTTGGAGGSDAIFRISQLLASSSDWTYATYIYIEIANLATTITLEARQRYLNASPPYDLGDGIVPRFIFLLVNNTPRTIDAIYEADCAPWHYNGPTDIRGRIRRDGRKVRLVKRLPQRLIDAADDPVARQELMDAARTATPIEEEITQAIKQADMPLIPHPWHHPGNDLTGKTVVLLDPVSDVVARLAELHDAGENISEIIYADYLRPDNTALPRSGPPGVRIVAPRWRNTG